jgi:hypothetical protein
MGHRRVPSRTIYAAEETIAGWLLRRSRHELLDMRLR